ncbi:MAG: anhydro-N-acetylmuramic acid kinase [Burkholderiales bacterium]
MPSNELYVGLMSGTSLDGVDAALVDFGEGRPDLVASTHLHFDSRLRAALLALSSSGENEIDRAGSLGIDLARVYAASVAEALTRAGVAAAAVKAIGCHGQTVRHRPERGYTVQIGNPALLAELSGIRVVADFRSRDMAAGGQGAPLAPAFHAFAFGSRDEDRAIVNLGGIANITRLPRTGPIIGFDCGPANCLLDLWAQKHLGKPMDEQGNWAASGRVDDGLLARFLAEPFLAATPPKSTGRELFNEAWLAGRGVARHDPHAVQATLLEFTARCVTQACERHCPGTSRLIVCGGGARNSALMARLRELSDPIPVVASDDLGVAAEMVEASAFAWLAKQAIEGIPASVPAVTGAHGARVLGAIYPK